MGSRLTSIDHPQELLPWRRAHNLTQCLLYWAPVTAFPIPAAQHSWLMEFLTRWTGLMKESGLRPEVFLQYKTVYPDLMKPLLNNMMELFPILGLGRKPGAALPEFPSKSDVEEMTKTMFDNLKQGKSLDLPDATKYMPDYVYWFLEKSDKLQRELFFGHGGLSIIFLKPDPNAAAPASPITPAQEKKLPLLKQLSKGWAQAHSLKDSFLPKSKEFFGTGLQDEPQMKGIPFILPLLDSSDFFSQSPDVIAQCFELFDVYVRESPADKGILLASKIDVEQQLIDLTKQIKEEGTPYPEV